MGSKSQAKTKAKERVLAKEAAQRMNQTCLNFTSFWWNLVFKT